MSSLSEKSKTLLEMIDELVEPNSPKKSKKSLRISTEIKNVSESQEFSPSPRLSDQMKTYLKQRNKVPEKLKMELIQNQEKIDSIVDQQQQQQQKASVIRPIKKVNRFKSSENLKGFKTTYSTDNSPLSTPKYAPSPKSSVTEIIMPNDVRDDDNEEHTVINLEFRLSLAEQALKQEREIRELLLNSLSKTVSCLCDKCMSIKPSTTKTITQMLQKIESPQAKVSTARLLYQQIDAMISEIPDNENLPSPILNSLSPKNGSSNPELDVLARGCSELADSLADGFYKEEIGDFATLAKTPIEFARQVNQLKKAHDVGIAELRAQLEVLTQRADKLEELGANTRISEETVALVNNLTQMIQEFSIQSRTEYEDLIENME